MPFLCTVNLNLPLILVSMAVPATESRHKLHGSQLAFSVCNQHIAGQHIQSALCTCVTGHAQRCDSSSSCSRLTIKLRVSLSRVGISHGDQGTLHSYRIVHAGSYAHPPVVHIAPCTAYHLSEIPKPPQTGTCDVWMCAARFHRLQCVHNMVL